MNNKFNCFFLLVILLFAGQNIIAAQKSNSEGNYEIKPVENISQERGVEKVWTLSYIDPQKLVTILFQKEGDKKNFIVRSGFFEVMYVSTISGFGIKEIKNSMREVPSQISSAVLNQEQMRNQKVISTEPVSDEYALGLIASYLPDLLNDGYKHLIY